MVDIHEGFVPIDDEEVMDDMHQKRINFKCKGELIFKYYTSYVSSSYHEYLAMQQIEGTVRKLIKFVN